MEIIDKLEVNKRGPYAGIVGYFDFSGNLDTAIAIRTMFWDGERAYMHAGAGIVADSNPDDEDLECSNKAKALLTAAGIASAVFGPGQEMKSVWLAEQAKIFTQPKPVDLDFGIVRVHGSDGLKFLQSLVSQDLQDMEVGECRPSLLLDPSGKMVAKFLVGRNSPEEWLLIGDRDRAEDLLTGLTRYLIRTDAEVGIPTNFGVEAIVSCDLSALETIGPTFLLARAEINLGLTLNSEKQNPVEDELGGWRASADS